MLYPREELTEAAGYPALLRFEPGRPDLPVVVFVTGGGVLGRVAYGPPDGRAADFLCHWLHEEGFSSLVLSYPVDNRGVFSRPDELAALPAGKWASLVEHVRGAAERLSATMPGNHMFFLGENGARRTVETLKHLRQTAADVRGEIWRLMA